MAETMFLNMIKENDLIDLVIKEKQHRESRFVEINSCEIE